MSFKNCLKVIYLERTYLKMKTMRNITEDTIG